MSHEKDTKSKHLQTPKSVYKEIRDLKYENARLKHKLMIQQALTAIECGKKPNWGIKNDH